MNRVARFFDVAWPILLFVVLAANLAASLGEDDPVQRTNNLLAALVILVSMMMHKPLAPKKRAWAFRLGVAPGHKWVVMNAEGRVWASAPFDEPGTLDLDFNPAPQPAKEGRP